MGRAFIEKHNPRYAEEADACLALRALGTSYRNIALEMTARGVRMSKDSAQRRVEWALDRIISPGVVRLRKLEEERLDIAVQALRPKVEEGDTQAIAQWIRVSESRRRLLGLDEPVKVDATVTELSPADVELEQLVDQVEAAAREREQAP